MSVKKQFKQGWPLWLLGISAGIAASHGEWLLVVTVGGAGLVLAYRQDTANLRAKRERRRSAP